MANKTTEEVPLPVEWLTLEEAAKLTGHDLQTFLEIVAASGVDLSQERDTLRVAKL